MKEKPLIGVMFILAGVLFLLANFELISFSDSWPLFLLVPGIMFYYNFFINRKNIGLLMPATILTMYGLMFFLCKLVGWENQEYLWPVYILAPGIGFYLMYFWGSKERKFLVPGSILVFVAILNFGFQDIGAFTWPIVLIGVGLFLLLLKK